MKATKTNKVTLIAATCLGLAMVTMAQKPSAGGPQGSSINQLPQTQRGMPQQQRQLPSTTQVTSKPMAGATPADSSPGPKMTPPNSKNPGATPADSSPGPKMTPNSKNPKPNPGG